MNERAFVVRHLLTDGELVLFDTNARMNSNPRQFPASGANFAGTEG